MFGFLCITLYLSPFENTTSYSFCCLPCLKRMPANCFRIRRLWNCLRRGCKAGYYWELDIAQIYAACMISAFMLSQTRPLASTNDQMTRRLFTFTHAQIASAMQSLVAGLLSLQWQLTQKGLFFCAAQPQQRVCFECLREAVQSGLQAQWHRNGAVITIGWGGLYCVCHREKSSLHVME